MLVLTIKEGEAVIVGDCTVRLIRMHDNKVQLGFEAPKTTKILREELVSRGRADPSGYTNEA